MTVENVVKCPECGSQRVWKDGIPYTHLKFSDMCAETVVVGFNARNTLHPAKLPFFSLFMLCILESRVRIGKLLKFVYQT